jgi:hypothetical protein
LQPFLGHFNRLLAFCLAVVLLIQLVHQLLLLLLRTLSIFLILDRVAEMDA